MKTSIAMATFNGAKYLNEQLQSFVQQARLPDELIVSDDASSDGTLDVLLKFQSEAPFKVVIIENKRNVGFVGNFERALERCAGDIVFLSDQDDVWFPNKIDSIWRVFEAETVSVVLNDQIVTDESLNPTGVTKLGNAKRYSAVITGCCTAMTSEFLKFCLPFPQGIPSHDGWIGSVAIALGVRKVFPEPLQYWRRHNSNTSRFYPKRHGLAAIMDTYGKWHRTDVVFNIDNELSMISKLICRFESCNNILIKKLGSAGVDGVMDRLRIREKILSERRNVLRSSGVEKFYKAAVFLKNGGYSHFSGIRSMFGDLVR